MFDISEVRYKCAMTSSLDVSDVNKATNVKDWNPRPRPYLGKAKSESAQRSQTFDPYYYHSGSTGFFLCCIRFSTKDYNVNPRPK